MNHLMESHLLILLITLVLLVGVASATTATPEITYWNTAFPNTPIPTAIKTSLPSKGNKSLYPVTEVRCNIYQHAATQKQVDEYTKRYGETYMVETQLIPERLTQVRLKTQTENKATFLTPQQSSTISNPFDAPAMILNQFSIKPKSLGAIAVENTAKLCQDEKLCFTSLESMVSFVKARLGDRATPASSSSVYKDGNIKYKIMGVKKVADYGSPAVACHKEQYPFAVFRCHQTEMAAAYAVSMVDGEGVAVKATAVCHRDTSWWNPKHVSFQVLKNKPGDPVCHFLDDLAVFWATN